jgi:hypothetical protein
MGRQEPLNPISHLFEEIDESVLCKNRLRVWAAQNAYTLIFLSVMFFVTWTLMALFNFVF